MMPVFNVGESKTIRDERDMIADRDREIERLQAELTAAKEAVAIRQAALEQRTAENEHLQQKLDLMADDPGAQYFMGIAEGQRIYERLKGAPFQVVDSPELAMLRDQVASLQARLAACPTVEQLRIWLTDMDSSECIEDVAETANRMEALNDR